MPHDHLLYAGSIAFEADVREAEIAISRREGLQDVHFIRSGPCTEHRNLTRYIVEVHDEFDAARARHWMDRVEEALMGQVGAMHRCLG